MAPDLRVITGDATIHDAARRVANALEAEDLRRARQHIRRLEDALRDHGATDAELDGLRYGTTPPIPNADYDPAAALDNPPPCVQCGDDGVGVWHGRVLCAAHAESDFDHADGEL